MSNPSFSRGDRLSPEAVKNKSELLGSSGPTISPTSVRFYRDEKIFLDRLTEELQKEFGKRVSVSTIIRALLHQSKGKSPEWYVNIIKRLPSI